MKASQYSKRTRLAIKHNWNPETTAIHAGEREALRDTPVVPIWQTATYVFRDVGEIADFLKGRSVKCKYGRYGNPAQTILENKLADLEHADEALIFSSGMNAITTAVLAIVKPGEHVVYCSSCYRNSIRFFEEILPAFGIRTTCVSPSDVDALRASFVQGTKLVFYEIPTNVLLRVADLGRVVELSKRQPGVVVMIDSTFSTPINLRPIAHGADLVIHSLTKYIGGHDDLLAGCVCGSHELLSKISAYRDILGGIPDPHNTFLLLRSLKTFPLRLERLNANGMAVAALLAEHEKVTRVLYPGLTSHPDHNIARKWLRGFGSVMYLELKGGAEAAKRFIEALQIPYIASNFGGVHTLVEPVSRLTYGNQTVKQRRALGIGENMIRLCVGIESLQDLKSDLEAALQVA